MAERTAPWSLGGALRGMFQKPTIDETTWDDLESALIRADFGPTITEEVVEHLRGEVRRFATTDPTDLRRMLRETLEERLARLNPTLTLSNRPAVVLVVGVSPVAAVCVVRFVTELSGLPGSVTNSSDVGVIVVEVDAPVVSSIPLEEGTAPVSSSTGSSVQPPSSARVVRSGVRRLLEERWCI